MDRRFLGSHRRPFSQLQRLWTLPKFSSSSPPPRLLALMCSSDAPPPLLASKARGPLQIRHFPTQFGPVLWNVESVSAMRLSLSASVINHSLIDGGMTGSTRGPAIPVPSGH